jgi:hypothetical protein
MEILRLFALFSMALGFSSGISGGRVAPVLPLPIHISTANKGEITTFYNFTMQFDTAVPIGGELYLDFPVS